MQRDLQANLGLDFVTMRLATLPLCASVAACFSMPALKGPLKVGVTSFELTDFSRSDPLAPDVRPRKLPISVWYPVSNDVPENYELSPMFTPAFQAYIDPIYLVPDGTSGAIISGAYRDAPLASANSNGRVLFFSPGYALHTVEFSTSLSNLASHGYVVVGTAHPFDANFIDYEDGTSVNNEGENATPADWGDSEYVALRAADMAFIAAQLTTNATAASFIPGVEGTLPKDQVGIFGHSYGGSTAAQSIVDGQGLFRCGLNQDSGIFAPANETGVSVPFLNVARNLTVDYTWEPFGDLSTGWYETIGIFGTLHMAFLDFLYIQQVWYEQGLVSDDYLTWAGTVEGSRMLDILDAVLTDFFDGCFGGEGYGVLEGPNDVWPEIRFDGFVVG